ncbi:MAG TPA: hypothetical protein DEV81_13400 [Cyanobacteria bacterium UBA11049]|nr:hypothetical protein [Cyanobacteria bacterium UBA11049]
MSAKIILRTVSKEIYQNSIIDSVEKYNKGKFGKCCFVIFNTFLTIPNFLIAIGEVKPYLKGGYTKLPSG